MKIKKHSLDNDLCSHITDFLRLKSHFFTTNLTGYHAQATLSCGFVVNLLRSNLGKLRIMWEVLSTIFLNLN